MTRTARAAVQVADRRIEMRDIPLPASVGRGEALLRVEGCGMCGTDYEQYVGAMATSGLLQRYPVIPGHEPVGRIELIGEEAKAAWGVDVDHRVAVEAMTPDGFCYSVTSLDLAPGLWGGYAEYLYLRPGTIVHEVPNELTVEDAVLFNPLASGFEWVARSGVEPGDTALVLGPGQRGLACVIALREAGAERIVVTGLARDRRKLELCRELGATDTLVADEVDVVAAVRELTDGRGVDRVLDLTPFATEAVTQAIAAARPGATIVLAGVKGGREVAGFVSDEIVFKRLTIVGVLGPTSHAVGRAIEVLASHRHPVERMHTHTVTIDELDHAIRMLGGEVEGEDPIHITVVPGTSPASLR